MNQSQNEEIDWSKLRRDPPNMSGIDFGEDNKTKVVHIEDLIEKEMEDSAIEVRKYSGHYKYGNFLLFDPKRPKW